MMTRSVKLRDHIHLHADLSYMAGLGRRIRAFSAAGKTPDESITGLELAVHEVAVNIIRHAYADVDSGWIDIRLSCDDRELIVVLEDQGGPFDPAMAVEPDLAVPREGGYGLYVARQLVDDVNYRRTASNNRWELRVDRGPQS